MTTINNKKEEVKHVQIVNLKGVEDPEIAMEKMDCRWNAESHELMTNTLLNVGSHKAIVRSDNSNVLGVVGKDYNPTQMSTYFAQFHALVKNLNLKYNKGIIYDGGKKIVLKADFEKPILVRVGDECKSELNWGTSFDGTMGNNGWFTILRLKCTNGMTVKSKLQQFSCRHTKNSESIMKERMQILLQSEKYFKDFEDSAKFLSSVVADKKMVDSFIASMFAEEKLNKKTNKIEHSTKTKNKIEEVKHLFDYGLGNGKGTAWDLYSGYTEWIDHKRSSNNETRFISATIGDGKNKKEKALETLLSIA